MRREVILSSVNRIVKDIEQTGVLRMLENMAQKVQHPGSKDSGTYLDLKVVTDYCSRTARYDEVTTQMTHILNIEKTADTDFWQRFLDDVDIGLLYDTRFKLQNVTDFLPRFAELLTRSYASQIDERHSPRSLIDGTEVQTVILTDEGESLSSPDRLIDVLHAVREIYKAIAIVEGHSPDGIAVVGLDSGSEKSFDFLGLAKVMQEVRGLFEFLYTSIAFHRQNATLKNLLVVSETIPIIQKIDILKNDKAIGEDEAGRLKHALLAPLEKFAAAGAYTPEMEKVADSVPALVMQPQPRLLTGPAQALGREDVSSAAADTATDSEPPVFHNESAPPNAFSAEQIAAAVALLEGGVQAQTRPTRSKTSVKRRATPRKKKDANEVI